MSASVSTPRKMTDHQMMSGNKNAAEIIQGIYGLEDENPPPMIRTDQQRDLPGVTSAPVDQQDDTFGITNNSSYTS